MSDETRATFLRGDAKECPDCGGWGDHGEPLCDTCSGEGTVCPLCGNAECVSDPWFALEEQVERATQGEPEPTPDDSLLICHAPEIAERNRLEAAAQAVRVAYTLWVQKRSRLAVALADLIAEPEGTTLGPAALEARVLYQSHLRAEPPKPEPIYQ